jgi:hypothetical protein
MTSPAETTAEREGGADSCGTDHPLKGEGQEKGRIGGDCGRKDGVRGEASRAIGMQASSDE